MQLFEQLLHEFYMMNNVDAYSHLKFFIEQHKTGDLMEKSKYDELEMKYLKLKNAFERELLWQYGDNSPLADELRKDAGIEKIAMPSTEDFFKAVNAITDDYKANLGKALKPK